MPSSVTARSRPTSSANRSAEAMCCPKASLGISVADSGQNVNIESGQWTIGIGMKCSDLPPRSMTSSGPTSSTARPSWYSATDGTPAFEATTRALGHAAMTWRRPELWSGSTWLTTIRSISDGSTTSEMRESSSGTNGSLTVSMRATCSEPITRYALYVVPRGVSYPWKSRRFQSTPPTHHMPSETDTARIASSFHGLDPNNTLQVYPQGSGRPLVVRSARAARPGRGEWDARASAAASGSSMRTTAFARDRSPAGTNTSTG